ncbi:hypothetical protein JCM5353_000408, partial [Sporobolomyces roseus]
MASKPPPIAIASAADSDEETDDFFKPNNFDYSSIDPTLRSDLVNRSALGPRRDLETVPSSSTTYNAHGITATTSASSQQDSSSTSHSNISSGPTGSLKVTLSLGNPISKTGEAGASETPSQQPKKLTSTK